MTKPRAILCYITLILLVGCTDPLSIILRDNLYLEKTALENADAPYIGDWTTAMTAALVSISINETGQVKICSSNPHFGTGNGIIYREQGKIFMIFEGGDTYEFISVTEDYILTKYFDHKYKFYSGRVPENCRTVFNKFQGSIQ
ncbi:hypothetical protein ES708_03955 [subsurface metagenome]